MTEEGKPPRVKPRITAAPKIGAIYWCDFPKDAQLPEFWKTRPVVVLSYRNTLAGTVTVLPLSTEPQDDNPWAVRLTHDLDGCVSWVVCDKPYTVATSRLSQVKGKVPRMCQEDFDKAVALLLKWLPKLPEPK